MTKPVSFARSIWNKAPLEAFRAGLTAERRDMDDERLLQVFNLSAKVPELKDALDWATEHGVEFIIDRQARCGGYYWPGSGVVALVERSSFHSDARLAGVVVHEIRHAWQDYYGMIATAETTFTNYFIKTALIEADATAHQMLAEGQMGIVSSREYLAKPLPAHKNEVPYFLIYREEMAAAIAEKEEKLSNREAFLWQAFRGWYSSFNPPLYGDAALRLFGKKLGIPEISQRNIGYEFKPESLSMHKGVDFTRDEQLRRLGKGFKVGNYFNVAARHELAKRMFSPSLAACIFDEEARKPQPLVAEVRRRELLLKRHKGQGVMISGLDL